ncbi:MAG TPA: hypothetical protein VN241_09135 [Microbacterium sp.]|nr:hypothetical protein [Microbacterium sp.]
MNTSLTRSLPYWLLLVISLATAAVGGWLIAGQIGTMTTTLLDGTATGVEVYVGQSMVVVGAVLLGAGVLGILLALVLAAARALLTAPVTAFAEPVDGTAMRAAEAEAEPTSTTDRSTDAATDEGAESRAAESADDPVRPEPAADTVTTAPAITR